MATPPLLQGSSLSASSLLSKATLPGPRLCLVFGPPEEQWSHLAARGRPRPLSCLRPLCEDGGCRVQGARTYTKWDPVVRPILERRNNELGGVECGSVSSDGFKTFKDDPSLMSSLRTHERGQGTLGLASFLSNPRASFLVPGVYDGIQTGVF